MLWKLSAPPQVSTQIQRVVILTASLPNRTQVISPTGQPIDETDVTAMPLLTRIPDENRHKDHGFADFEFRAHNLQHN